MLYLLFRKIIIFMIANRTFMQWNSLFRASVWTQRMYYWCITSFLFFDSSLYSTLTAFSRTKLTIERYQSIRMRWLSINSVHLTIALTVIILAQMAHFGFIYRGSLSCDRIHSFHPKSALNVGNDWKAHVEQYHTIRRRVHQMQEILCLYTLYILY
jgi:hypothetical protein